MLLTASVPRPSLAGHIRLARFDHWVKILFALPGIVVALSVDPARLGALDWWRVLAGLTAIGLMASSNYVLNELLDAPFDRLHPLKKHRPVPAGLVHVPLAWAEWLLLAAASAGLGMLVSPPFLLILGLLWAMGLVYNVPPLRAKDHPYVDVLAEAANNPLRFAAGWYLTGTQALPITSLLVSLWMAGCYLMALKRYAELRDHRTAFCLQSYRPSFRRYTERSLLVSITFYAALAMLSFGAFMGRYRLELVLAFPLIALCMAVYFALVFKPDSAAQHPEGLLREPLLMLATIACALAMLALLFVDVPWLHHAFQPTAASWL